MPVQVAGSLFGDFFEAAAAGLALVGLDGRFLKVNDKMCGICGYSREEMLALTFRDITFGEDLAEDESNVAKLLRGDFKEYTLKKRYVRKCGEVVWVEIIVSVIKDCERRAQAFAAVIRDITEEKQLEATRNLLIGEMNHRVKNTLAVVQGIVKQTLEYSPTPEHFAAAIESRLFSISRAYDLLNLSEWRPVAFSQIVMAKRTGPFSAYAQRIVHRGDDTTLAPQSAVLVNLVLHELATNAVKYGALRNDTGTVAITTDRFAGEQGDMFRIQWTEAGGPAVDPPSRKGFGQFMLMRGVQFGLSGRSDARFEVAGLEYVLTFPIESS